MVEERILFEWSPEVALAQSMRNCDWVIPEEDKEDQLSQSSAGGPITTTSKERSKSKSNTDDDLKPDRSGSINMVGIENTLQMINRDADDDNSHA